VENKVEKKDFDISVIRPEILLTDLKQRGQGMPSDRLKSIKEGLQTLHTLETMAANIYKFDQSPAYCCYGQRDDASPGFSDQAL
jgi:hypothetical protein